MKKALHGCLISLAILCFFIMPSAALSAEWVLAGSQGNGSRIAFYDKQSIVLTENKTSKVWIKFIYNDIGKRDVIITRAKFNLTTAGYENLGYSIQQQELNCKTRELRILATVDYGQNHDVLDSIDYNDPNIGEGWTSITPDSLGEAILKKLCVTRKKK